MSQIIINSPLMKSSSSRNVVCSLMISQNYYIRDLGSSDTDASEVTEHNDHNVDYYNSCGY